MHHTSSLTAFEIPGPPGKRFLGHIPEMARDPLGLVARTAQTYGGLARLNFAGREVYLASSPEAVQYILRDNAHNFIRGRAVEPARLLMGNGLPLADGEPWLRQRRLMQPAFHQRRLATYLPYVIESTRRFIQMWQRIPSGKRLDFSKEMMKLTLDIIVTTMFSADIRPEIHELERNFNIVQSFIYRRSRGLVTLPLSFPTPTHLRIRSALRKLNAIIYRVIEQGKKQPKDDLLGMLLRARDPETGLGMSDRQLRDEVMTIFFAGHETTATLMTWVLYVLASQPEIGHRLRQEVEQVLQGADPAYEDLARLTYMERVLLETLRFYPPTWMFTRELVHEDCILGYPLPAGTTILLSPYATHHHPAYWQNPEQFDPERFLPENSIDRHPFAYFPFGGGTHQCIGNTFALMEAKTILSLMMQKFRWSLPPGFHPGFKPEVTLRVRRGLPLRLEPVG